MDTSIDMKVLRALRNASAHDVWQSPSEVAQSAGVLTSSVGSSIRRLRTQGFVINHKKRDGRVREYSLRWDSASR